MRSGKSEKRGKRRGKRIEVSRSFSECSVKEKLDSLHCDEIDEGSTRLGVIDQR